MKLHLRHRRTAGSILLGIFVIVIVVIFLLGVWSIASRASRIKPRQIDYDQTNSFWTIDRRDTVYLTPPNQPDPGPPGIVTPRSAIPVPLWFCFTNELVFVDSETFSNSWLTVERTQDHVNWTILQWIMYDRPRYTNGMVYQVFVDMYAPAGMNFYRGIIHTNNFW